MRSGVSVVLSYTWRSRDLIHPGRTRALHHPTAHDSRREDDHAVDTNGYHVSSCCCDDFLRLESPVLLLLSLLVDQSRLERKWEAGGKSKAVGVYACS